MSLRTPFAARRIQRSFPRPTLANFTSRSYATSSRQHLSRHYSNSKLDRESNPPSNPQYGRKDTTSSQEGNDDDSIIQLQPPAEKSESAPSSPDYSTASSPSHAGYPGFGQDSHDYAYAYQPRNAYQDSLAQGRNDYHYNQRDGSPPPRGLHQERGEQHFNPPTPSQFRDHGRDSYSFDRAPTQPDNAQEPYLRSRDVFSQVRPPQPQTTYGAQASEPGSTPTPSWSPSWRPTSASSAYASRFMDPSSPLAGLVEEDGSDQVESSPASRPGSAGSGVYGPGSGSTSGPGSGSGYGYGSETDYGRPRPAGANGSGSSAWGLNNSSGPSAHTSSPSYASTASASRYSLYPGSTSSPGVESPTTSDELKLGSNGDGAWASVGEARSEAVSGAQGETWTVGNGDLPESTQVSSPNSGMSDMDVSAVPSEAVSRAVAESAGPHDGESASTSASSPDSDGIDANASRNPESASESASESTSTATSAKEETEAETEAESSSSDTDAPTSPPQSLRDRMRDSLSQRGADWKSALASQSDSWKSALTARGDEWKSALNAKGEEWRTTVDNSSKEWLAAASKNLTLLGGKVNEVTGYANVEALKRGVKEKELDLESRRRALRETKHAYERAIQDRTVSQQNVNSLLERKHTWSDSDVAQFTTLVRSDHATRHAVDSTSEQLKDAEAKVDKAFTSLMQGILERYHEEQVWSDKIRSVSTWFNIVALAANLIVFMGAIAFIEPWKRRRMVEGLEERVSGMMDEVRAEINGLSRVVETRVPDVQALGGGIAVGGPESALSVSGELPLITAENVLAEAEGTGAAENTTSSVPPPSAASDSDSDWEPELATDTVSQSPLELISTNPHTPARAAQALTYAAAQLDHLAPPSAERDVLAASAAGAVIGGVVGILVMGLVGLARR